MEQVILKDLASRVEAHRLYRKALKAGKLVRAALCSECGKACKTHGHHEDYSKPLKVIWLCPNCHARRGSPSKVDCIALSRNLYREGKSIQDIAHVIRVHRTTVWRWCKDLKKEAYVTRKKA